MRRDARLRRRVRGGRRVGKGCGRASCGVEGLAAGTADALARGQHAGRVPVDLDPDDGARFVLALLPGMILQRAAGHDTAGAVARAAAALLDR